MISYGALLYPMRVSVPCCSDLVCSFVFHLCRKLILNRKPRAVAAANSSKKSIFEFPHLILGALAIFLHVGTQVIAIDTIIGYANSMKIDLLEAKVFPSYTLFATICGYILGIICIPKYISQLNALRFCTLLGALLTIAHPVR